MNVPKWWILLAALAALLLAGCEKREFVAKLEYADGQAGPTLPYSVPRRLDLLHPDSLLAPVQLPDTLSGTPLIAAFDMGNTGRKIHLLLSKTDAKSRYYDLLHIDRNQDLNFQNDGPPLHNAGQFVQSRNRHYSEFSSVSFTYKWKTNTEVLEEPFVATVYFWYPKDEPPQTLTLLRESWREGVFTFRNSEATVILVDDELNGVYDANDRWALIPRDSLGRKHIASRRFFRDATRYGWLGETAFQLDVISPQGDWVKLTPKKMERDELLTREEDIARDTPYAEEPRRPKAARAISWLTGYNRALNRARRGRRNILVDFCTDWSGPCLVLRDRTFTDAEIVGLSDQFVCLRLNGDKERALVEKFNIKNYPTLLILDYRGRELSRVVGYQAASEFSFFLKQHLKS